MKRLGLTTLGIAAAISSLAAFQAKPPTQGAAKKTVSPIPAPETSSCNLGDIDGPWTLLCRYYSHPVEKTAQAMPPSPWSCVPPGKAPKFLIASLPDPDTTHLSLYFDREVESIMRAMVDANYRLSGYWLPWQINAEQPLSTFADRQCQSKAAETRAALPGLLLFSDASGDPALGVFVVGESPTSGINLAQFESAVDAIQNLHSGGSIRIGLMGPTFSGSLQPLGAELKRKNWLGSDLLSFDVVSGTVTSFDDITNFKSLLKSPSDYQSVIENDTSAADRFLHYAEEEWNGPYRVGILSEDETAYSAGFAKGTKARALAKAHDWTPFVYPRQISRLRNTSQLETQPPESQEKSSQPQVPRPQFSLRDVSPDAKEGRERDSVPAFSALQSPASQNAALAGISTALRRERVDYIGIVATDVLDGVFLSRYVQESVPDTRLFTLDADLMFTSQDDAPLTGMLSITTYPLVSRNQHWTGWGRAQPAPRVEFPSRYAQGVYNACRKLMHDLYKPKDADAGLIEYTHPGDPTSQTPPLWLTVVGRDGYWPVALLDQGRNLYDPTLTPVKPAKGGTPETGQIHPETPGRGWFLCFWAIILLSGVHCWFVSYLMRHSGEANLAQRMLTLHDKALWAYPDPRSALKETERLFLMAISVCAACGLFVLGMPIARFGLIAFRNPVAAYFYLGSALAALLALVALAIWLGSWAVNDYWPLVSLIAALGVGVIGVWYSLVMAPEYRMGEFFSYRCLTLSSGVAPAVPILILAIVCLAWALAHLKRAEQTKKRTNVGLVFQEVNSETKPLAGGAEIKCVDNAIENLFSNNIWAPAIPFLLLWVMIFVPWRAFRSFESGWYDSMYIVLLAVVYWAIVVTWMQFIWCWREFKSFLQWLERQPWRDSFSRLRKEITLVPLVSRPPERQLYLTSRSYDCLRAIAGFDGSALGSESEGRLTALKGQIKLRLGEFQQDLDGNDINDVIDMTYENYATRQGAMEGAAREIAQDLTRWAWKEGSSDSLQRKLEDDVEKSQLTPTERLRIVEEEFIAFRYLTYIRYVLRQMRILLGFIIWGFVLAVVSTSSYPFQGHRWIGLANTVTFIALAVGIGVVFAQMERDAIMSRLTNTKANELGRSFFIRLAQYGSLPLVTLLASQFPTINKFLFFWVQPALSALK